LLVRCCAASDGESGQTLRGAPTLGQWLALVVLDGVVVQGGAVEILAGEHGVVPGRGVPVVRCAIGGRWLGTGRWTWGIRGLWGGACLGPDEFLVERFVPPRNVEGSGGVLVLLLGIGGVAGLESGGTLGAQDVGRRGDGREFGLGGLILLQGELHL